MKAKITQWNAAFSMYSWNSVNKIVIHLRYHGCVKVRSLEIGICSRVYCNGDWEKRRKGDLIYSLIYFTTEALWTRSFFYLQLRLLHCAKVNGLGVIYSLVLWLQRSHMFIAIISFIGTMTPVESHNNLDNVVTVLTTVKCREKARLVL